MIRRRVISSIKNEMCHSVATFVIDVLDAAVLWLERQLPDLELEVCLPQVVVGARVGGQLGAGLDIGDVERDCRTAGNADLRVLEIQGVIHTAHMPAVASELAVD